MDADDRAGAVSGLTDDELVQLAVRETQAGGGGPAAGELLSRYQLRVYRWCRRYARDHERALDLSQDVLLLAYRALGSFEGRAPFSAWLFTITRRRCIRAMRPVSMLRYDDAELELIPDDRPGADRALEDEDELQRMMELVRSCLDPVEQKALMMRCMERIPVDEITQLLGIAAASGARGVLQQARRKLRAASHEDDAGDGRTP
jgi:RNA polymerase sigma-70 factor (ECF subfamily)